MKSFKRDAVILTVVIFVCVAAYLNWSYGKKTDAEPDAGAQVDAPRETQDILPAESQDAEPGLYFDASAMTQQAEYFATARLNRRQARDEAVETLSAVKTAEGASQEVVDAALAKITAIASDSQREAELEALIMARGFADCVVFMSDDGVRVTVPAPESGLSSVDVAKITDAVTAETSYKAADLNVIEVKN
ncbi:MAG: SpoIIIAH-like family protein [Oscillospiraceae bacterium]|jgi:stage III sporulation protein AH|nr:SpoIIIAH-like family protein [Oscillospiraceae bacterium]